MYETRFSPAYLMLIGTTVLLLASVAGCGSQVDQQATNVLGTEESIFANVEMDQMVTVRSAGTAKTVSTLDLSLLAPQHFLAIVVEGKQLKKYFESRGKDINKLLLEPKPSAVSLDDFSQLLFMLDDSVLQSVMSGGKSSAGWSVQLTFKKAVDRAAWQKWILGPTSIETKMGDKDAQVLSSADLGMMWVDDQKAILASKEGLKAIQKRAGQEFSTQLGKRIAEHYNDDFVFLGMQAEPVRKLVDELAKFAASWGQADERLNTFIAGARALEDVEFRAKLTGDDLGQLQLRFADEASAKGIKTLVAQGIEQLSSMVGSSSPPAGAPANPAAGISAELQNLLKDIQKELTEGGLQTVQQENIVTLKMQRPSRFDELVDQSLDSWQKAKLQLFRVRKVGEISVALQRFEKKYGRLPANSGSPLIYENTGTPTAADDSPAFSWRVALLPELGYQELYDAFDFTQPWDSDTNLKVASRMPAVFASQYVPESGEGKFIEDDKAMPKSDFHLLTGTAGAAGDAAIFASKLVKDKADRTIFVHQTPQLSSDWTKPDNGWEVADANDLAKLQSGTEEPLLAIFYSGRVVAITPQVSREEWLGWVTPAGKESIDRTLLNQVTVFDPLKDLE